MAAWSSCKWPVGWLAGSSLLESVESWLVASTTGDAVARTTILGADSLLLIAPKPKLLPRVGPVDFR